MKRFSFILSLILAVVVGFLALGENAIAAKKVKAPQIYTPEKIESLQIFVNPVQTARERMTELEGYVNRKDWNNVRSIIHGPFGQLRADMLNLSRNLLPKDQLKAKELTKDLFGKFEFLDAAAKDQVYRRAIEGYDAAVADFDAFLQLIPH